MLFRPADRQRSSVFKYKNDGLSGGDDGLEKLLLVARQVEAGAIKTFTRDALPFPETKNNDIRLLCQLDGGINVFAGRGDDGCLRDDRSNAIEQADVMAIRFALVVAVARYIGIGTYDRDTLGGFCKGKEVAIVLEQRHGLAC